MLFCCLVGDVIPDWRASLIWYDIVHRCGEPNDDSPASSQLVKTQICILHLPRELSEVLTIQIAPTRSRSSKKAGGRGEPRSRLAKWTSGKTYYSAVCFIIRLPTEGNLLGPPSTSLSVFSIAQSCWTRHAAELIKGQWLNRFPQSDPHNSSALRFHGETWGFPFFHARLSAHYLMISLQWFLSICAVEGHLAKRPVRALLNGLQRLQAGCHVLTCLFQSKHLKCGPTWGYNFIPQYVLDELLWTRPSSLGINLTTTKPGVPISLRCGITGLDKQICHYLVDTQSRWTLSDMICCLNFLCVPKHEGLYIRRIDMRLLDGAANHGVWFMRPECGELSPVWIHRTGTVLQWHIDRGVRFRPTRLQAASKQQPKSTLWLCILFPHQALTCNAHTGTSQTSPLSWGVSEGNRGFVKLYGIPELWELQPARRNRFGTVQGLEGKH